MDILTLGPDPNTPTDGMIQIGVHTILKAAFPNYSYKHVLLGDTIRGTGVNSPEDFHPGQKFDLIVQCGTPFIWDQMEKSLKWSNFKTCLETHPNTHLVLMGIGSCYYLDATPPPLHQEVIDVFNKATVIVRDELAASILNKAGVGHVLLPCPAFYSVELSPNHATGTAVVWYDPRIGIAKGYWADKEKYDWYLGEFKKFILKNWVRDIYYVDDKEYPVSEFGSNYNYIKLNSPQDVIDMANLYKNIMSGRVHCAIPAHAAGRDTSLMAVDTRAMSFNYFRDKQLSSYFGKYLEILCAVQR